jgi:hypothetical protein
MPQFQLGKEFPSLEGTTYDQDQQEVKESNSFYKLTGITIYTNQVDN